MCVFKYGSARTRVEVHTTYDTTGSKGGTVVGSMELYVVRFVLCAAGTTRQLGNGGIHAETQPEPLWRAGLGLDVATFSVTFAENI